MFEKVLHKQQYDATFICSVLENSFFVLVGFFYSKFSPVVITDKNDWGFCIKCSVSLVFQGLSIQILGQYTFRNVEFLCLIVL